MAPKKASTAQKGKTKAQASTSLAAVPGPPPTGALPLSRVDAKMLDGVRYLAAAKTQEIGSTGMEAYGSSKIGAGYYPIFLHTLYAGLVPPFSSFLMAILETYQIQLLHLHL